jgi:hypothetical protein
MTFCEVSIFTIYSKHEFKTLMKVNFNKELEGKALMFTDIRATEHINFSNMNIMCIIEIQKQYHLFYYIKKTRQIKIFKNG